MAGRSYYDARIWGAPATLCNMALIGWYLGREESRHALLMTVCANLGNVLLDYVFIARRGMAARGAGLATMLSQYLSVAVGLALYRLLTFHAGVIAAAVQYGGFLLPVLLFGSAAYIYDGLFLGLTEGALLRNSMLFSTVVVFAPVALLAVRYGSNRLLRVALALFMVSRASTLGLAARRRLSLS